MNERLMAFGDATEKKSFRIVDDKFSEP